VAVVPVVLVVPSRISWGELLVRLPGKGSREAESGQSVMEGVGTSVCGAKNGDRGAPGAGLVGEREGTQTGASQGHELRDGRVVRVLGMREKTQ
jgi:hypothetical protein